MRESFKLRLSRRAFLSAVAFVIAIATGLPAAHAQYALHTLASFNGANGANPEASLISDAAGNLYGTTTKGGGRFGGDGNVFEIAAGTNTITTVATFTGVNGAQPSGSLLADAAGNLYGTTYSGGANDGGTVFEIAAGTNTITTLAIFNGANGAQPSGSLIADSAGNLYGTTYAGGSRGDGTVFKIAAGTNAITTLATFYGDNGANPSAGLISDTAGNLYGTATGGGDNGDGTVFALANFGNSFYVPLGLAFNYSNGAGPVSGLIMDVAGNLYGTTNGGGANGDGTVFEIVAGTNTITTLATFNYDNGDAPAGGLIRDAAGNLYGTTFVGGEHNAGTVYEIAAGTNTLTTLATFTGGNGSGPVAGLIADGAGNLYGTTTGGGANSKGTVFKLTPASTSLPVATGPNQITPISGGSANIGGGTVTFPNVTGGGTLDSHYQAPTTLADLAAALGAPGSQINFGLVGEDADGNILPGSAVQLWDLHYTGDFTGSATVTLHYDPALTGGDSPADFQIYHFTGGAWVAVANEVVDPVADTITFTTDSFSPFVLGVAVPEPGTFALAAMATIGLIVAGRARGGRR